MRELLAAERTELGVERGNVDLALRPADEAVVIAQADQRAHGRASFIRVASSAGDFDMAVENGTLPGAVR